MHIDILQFVFFITFFSAGIFVLGLYLGNYKLSIDEEYQDNDFCRVNYFDLTDDGVKLSADGNYDKGYARGYKNGYEECFSLHYLREKRQAE